MKRALFGTLWVGGVAAAITLALAFTGLLWPLAGGLDKALRLKPIANLTFGNCLLTIGLGFAFAWIMQELNSVPRRLIIFLVAIAELIGAAWMLSRAGIAFSPWPPTMAAATASILATIVRMSGPFRQRRLAHEIFGGRLAQQGHDHLAENIGNGFSEPMVRNATLVFCEIVNGPELIDELPLAECARLTREFVERGRKHFLQAGGYLQGADGEGICALFGFPNENRLHAVEAARAALSFRDQFRVLAREQPESLGKIDLRIGINSGTVVATLRDDRPGSELVIAGEPFEVARRLARANEIYGSEVLLGPQTYHAAGDEILARPMDFLRDGEDHERLEVYELLALSEQATPEAVARRDRFWTGVVYFRERRWNEAFAEFDRARNGDEETDRPLQWYLRQLEPHRLKMTTNPAEAVNPVLPLS